MGVQFRVIVPAAGLCSMPTDFVVGTMACNVLLGRGHAAGLLVATKEVPPWCERILRAELLLNVETDIGAADEPFGNPAPPVHGDFEEITSQRVGEFLETVIAKVPTMQPEVMAVVSMVSNLFGAIHRDRRARAARWQAMTGFQIN